MKVRLPRRYNIAAKNLANSRYRKRVIRDKKKYSRKGRNSSTRKFEGSIESTRWSRGFIE